MKIAKFGGTSVASAERLLDVISIIRSHPEYTVVVVSAMSGITNTLISLAQKAALQHTTVKEEAATLFTRHVELLRALVPTAQQGAALVSLRLWWKEIEELLYGISLVRELTAKTLDTVMSFGERAVACILAEALQSRGIAATYIDARELIVTDARFGNAAVHFERTHARCIERFAHASGVSVVTGFIAATEQGETTTLGRGGSDYTASIIGAALGAEEIAIWTDVDGMMTADPRKVSRAFSLKGLSYDEALELCHFGAKVVYPPTLQPALLKNIPIRVCNTLNPTFEGTVIGKAPYRHEYPITGISSIDSVSLIKIEGNGLIGVAGIAGRLFTALSRAAVSVILISQASSEYSICFAVAPRDSERAVAVVNDHFELEIQAQKIQPAVIEPPAAIISIVGDNMRRTTGVSARLFRALASNGVNVVAIAQGSSERNISVVIPAHDERKALNAVHDAFFVTQLKTAHLCIVGTGLIGSTLLKQIEEQRETLRAHHALELKVVVRANSRMREIVLEEHSAHQAPYHPESLIQEIRALNLPHTIFVDCTASSDIAGLYGDLLSAAIPVVTPNKKLQSGDLNRYRRCKEISRAKGVPWLYETSVGAGLPVISTLADLVKSGDEIISIEGVLSGTLSYLFNRYATDLSVSFSQLVIEAKSLGYTEPDPRDDLSGRDVARKLLILAREAGAPLLESEVSVEGLLPDFLVQERTVESFMARLSEVDSIYHQKRLEAQSKGQKLTYVATYNARTGKAQAALQSLDANHPLYTLSGSENSIAFTTKRYLTTPLVVKGPGAGAEVTAAGVFADIIRVASMSGGYA
jgi:aspartokinase/homoserine dehydrogenase 1